MSTDQDWVNELEENYTFFFLDLTSYAKWQAGTVSWAGSDSHTLPGGWTPEDIAQHIILKAITGKRRYDPAKGPLRNWLRYQVHSVISHLAGSALHRHEAVLLDVESIEDSYSVKPESTLIAKQDHEAMSETIAGIYAAADADPDALIIVEAVLDGCEPKPRHLAQELNVSVNDINNRWKRLRRAGRKFKAHDRS